MTGGTAYRTEQMESLLGWWQLAGVEEFCAPQPVNWLEMPAPRVQPVGQRSAGHSPAAPRAAVPSALPGSTSPASPSPASSLPAPTSLDALHERLRRGADLPGTGYGQARALAQGDAGRR